MVCSVVVIFFSAVALTTCKNPMRFLTAGDATACVCQKAVPAGIVARQAKSEVGLPGWAFASCSVQELSWDASDALVREVTRAGLAVFVARLANQLAFQLIRSWLASALIVHQDSLESLVA